MDSLLFISKLFFFYTFFHICVEFLFWVLLVHFFDTKILMYFKMEGLK